MVILVTPLLAPLLAAPAARADAACTPPSGSSVRFAIRDSRFAMGDVRVFDGTPNDQLVGCHRASGRLIDLGLQASDEAEFRSVRDAFSATSPTATSVRRALRRSISSQTETLMASFLRMTSVVLVV